MKNKYYFLSSILFSQHFHNSCLKPEKFISGNTQFNLLSPHHPPFTIRLMTRLTRCVYKHQQRKTEIFVINDIFYDLLNHKINGFACFAVINGYHWYKAELDLRLQSLRKKKLNWMKWKSCHKKCWNTKVSVRVIWSRPNFSKVYLYFDRPQMHLNVSPAQFTSESVGENIAQKTL